MVRVHVFGKVKGQDSVMAKVPVLAGASAVRMVRRRAMATANAAANFGVPTVRHGETVPERVAKALAGNVAISNATTDVDRPATATMMKTKTVLPSTRKAMRMTTRTRPNPRQFDLSR
jgi:hypothetical protein